MEQKAWRREQWLAYLQSALPGPVAHTVDDNGWERFVGGDPEEVIAHLTPTRVIVSIYRVEWPTPSAPVCRPVPVGSVYWRRMPMSDAMKAVELLVGAARHRRRAQFVQCPSCGAEMPPEFMVGELCQVCANPGGRIH